MKSTYSFKFPQFVLTLGIFILIPLWESMGGTVNIEKTTYKGWEKCYRMTNEEVELIVVADMGPRIVYLGLAGGENLFYLDEKDLGLKEADEWHLIGGHRFWIAPELEEFTYYPDMDEVNVEVEKNRITLTAPPEILDDNIREQGLAFNEIEKRLYDPDFRKALRVQKQMIITMMDDGEIIVEHRATNRGVDHIEMAPWALTVMQKGGFVIVPNPPYAPHGPGHFLPERSLITWSFTDLRDPRLSYMEKYITLQQDSSIEKPIKLGISDPQGWVATAVSDVLFVKTLEYFPEEPYPDLGSSVELFTNPDILEVESLGPEVILKPNDTTAHVEHWQLFKASEITNDEQSIDQTLSKLGIID